MGEAFIISLGRESLFTIFALVSPLLLSALAIGLIVSIFQAITQIQDMTLTFVPKFLIVGFIIAIMGGTLVNIMQTFTIRIITNIAYFTR